jgi:hypothetical protein
MCLDGTIRDKDMEQIKLFLWKSTDYKVQGWCSDSSSSRITELTGSNTGDLVKFP